MRRASVVLLLCAASCARTGLLDFGRGESDDGSGGSSGGGNVDECFSSSDCPVEDFCAPPVCRSEGSGSSARMRCIATPKDCRDDDPCTSDRCDPTSGLCHNEPPVDRDGDGFVAKPPPDEPSACGGEDCDDTDPSINPLGIELCDGRDNDCDRGIDEDLDYTSVSLSPVPLLPLEHDRADRAGLVWNGESYGVSYSTNLGIKQSYFKLMSPLGQDVSEPVEVSDINADAYAGSLAWSGSNFFTAFSDARQGGGYEIYAARFRADGVRVQSDVRLTDAPDFSLNPVVVWTGDDYVVAWDDRRGRALSGRSSPPQVYARRFTESGMPIGEEVLISEGNEHGESPALAVGDQRLGVVYITAGADLVSRARFRSFDRTLADPTPAIDVPGSNFANAQTVVYAGGTFMIAWQQTFVDLSPGAAIFVAAVDEVSGAASGGQATTFGFAFARQPSLVSLGDRSVLVFSGAAGDGKYEIWGTTVTRTLAASSALRLTFSEPMSFLPFGARGPDGTIGIVFDERDETPPNSRRPYFMAIGCRPLLE